MIVKAFAVFDIKTAAFGQPFFSATRASAQRSFLGACQDKQTMLGTHPEDFQLFDLGGFDDQSGMLIPQNPEFIMSGVNTNAA